MPFASLYVLQKELWKAVFGPNWAILDAFICIRVIKSPETTLFLARNHTPRPKLCETVPLLRATPPPIVCENATPFCSLTTTHHFLLHSRQTQAKMRQNHPKMGFGGILDRLKAISIAHFPDPGPSPNPLFPRPTWAYYE